MEHFTIDGDEFVRGRLGEEVEANVRSLAAVGLIDVEVLTGIFFQKILDLFRANYRLGNAGMLDNMEVDGRVFPLTDEVLSGYRIEMGDGDRWDVIDVEGVWVTARKARPGDGNEARPYAIAEPSLPAQSSGKL